MKKFVNLSLKRKFVIVFAVVMIVNAVITGCVYYAFENSDTTDDFRANAQDMVKQIELYLGDKIVGLTGRITALGNNLSFAEPMKTFLHDDQSSMDAILSGNVARMISEIKSSEKFVDSIYIYTDKGTFDDYMLIRKNNTSFADTEMYHWMKENPLVKTAWFPAMENPVYESVDIVIPVVYRMAFGNRDIFFVVNLSQKAIQEYLDTAYSSMEQVFLVDKNAENVLGFSAEQEGVLRAFDSAQSEESSVQLNLNGNEYLAVRTSVPKNGWYIYALMSLEPMTQSLQQFRLFLIAENTMVLLVGLVVILLLSNSLTSSLEKLAKAMDGAVKSGYHTEFVYEYHDEVGTLARSYNHMIAEIRQHIQALEEEKERVKAIQKQKRKAELQALQAQINPHFLYNTLNMVTWRAVEIGDDTISIISTALGEYFRIGLSKGREIISIKDEIEHIHSYLEIQKIRYEEKLNFEICIPEELENLHIVKLTLQPLVENAIYHGIKEKDGPGNVWITAYRQDGSIFLIVEDNGAGMTEDKLSEINRNLAAGLVDSSSGYGIYNVNNRLRLYYGEDYGLCFAHTNDNGVRAIVRIPVSDREGDNHVSDCDC